MKRIFGNGSYANVTATLALIVALGGTSYAAIKLPKNSVSSLQVKDRSLLKKDFRPGQLPRGLKGATGAAGPAGPAGAGGAGGSSGGFVNRAEGVDALVPGTGDQVIQSMSLPAGSWIVSAKFIAENATAVAGGTLACTLTLGGAAIDTLGPGVGIDFDQGASSNALTGGGSLSGAGTATVVCNTNNTVSAGSYRARSMTAVSASSVAAG
ncbi:MAG: hypothetical protein QOI64_1722 [Solirubrobacteraceae bacterium]|nr:hypothetical protein [Solirubrobacteraceae bacterium]